MNDDNEKSFEDHLREAMDDLYEHERDSTMNDQQDISPCGCVDRCGDISKHDESTVLEGIILDPEDRTYEDSTLQDAIKFARRVKFANL
jgi:hypothetical protein